MANRVINFDAPVSVDTYSPLLNKTMNKSFSELCDFYKNSDTDILLWTWRVTQTLKSSYKVEAAISRVLIERKCVLEYNQTLVECIDLMGMNKDDLFTWLDQESLNESKAELLSYIHTLLSINYDNKRMLQILPPQDRIASLRFSIQPLGSIDPSLKYELFDLLKYVHLSDWNDLIRRLKKLLDTTDNLEEKREILKTAVTSSGKDPVSLLKHTVIWFEMLNNKESIIPIMKHISTCTADHLHNVPAQASFLHQGTNPTSETLLKRLKFLTRFTSPFRTPLIDQLRQHPIPPEQKFSTFCKFLFVELTLKLFPPSSNLKIKDPRTRLSHIR